MLSSDMQGVGDRNFILGFFLYSSGVMAMWLGRLKQSRVLFKSLAEHGWIPSSVLFQSTMALGPLQHPAWL